ncbi:MAG: tetratricopeptide repeat protein [Propionivibrio sp.]|nr:tetratricopeptide repeat protein [Propionivibrio sp.]
MFNWLQNTVSKRKKAGYPSDVTPSGGILSPPAIEPFRSSSHKRSGDAFLGEGKLDEAAGSYRLAIAANRDDAEAHLNLGFVLSEQQRYEEAERSLKQALAINPAMADALYILGVISKAQGNAEDAINSFTQAIEYKPDFEIVWGFVRTAVSKRATRARQRSDTERPCFVSAECRFPCFPGQPVRSRK